MKARASTRARSPRPRAHGLRPGPATGRQAGLPALELSPEVETAVADGVALEFEVPILDGRVAAFKPAVQVTFGTAFEERFIHGLQVNAQYETSPSLWAPTAVYIAGLRMNETWSAMGMVGARGELGCGAGGGQVEILANLSVFADLHDRHVVGLEVNYGQLVGGEAATLVMPQWHCPVSQQWVVQAGIGARVTSHFTVPELIFRVIREL